MGVGRRQVAIAVTVILVAVVYVFITGISDTMVYYYNVSEVSERRAELVGDALRVHGQVVPGSIEKDPTGLVHKSNGSGNLPRHRSRYIRRPCRCRR